MSISSVADARFDHVDEDGELVFVSKGLKFRIPVDDTLEHAILEARQILSETDEASNPGMAQTLPISSIQALIRAGAQPEKVAEKYGLSQALVRRFSAAVETEKQYAIEQFLAVSAPKGSKVHSVEELIARTLAAARIGIESVEWGATRRGREPWLITATFSTQRNRIRAEWSWNMHDNTVECQNAAAQILLGEGESARTSDESNDAAQETPAQNSGSEQAQENIRESSASAAQTSLGGGNDAIATAEFSTSQALPGDSVRSARIASTVASMQETTENDASPTTGSRTATDYGHTEQENLGSAGSVSLPYPAPTANPQPSSTNPSASASVSDETVPVDALSLPLPNRTPTAQPEMFTPFSNGSEQQAENNDAAISSTDNAREGNQETNEDRNQEDRKHNKRKSGRSAVPSWDEILFGE